MARPHLVFQTQDNQEKLKEYLSKANGGADDTTNCASTDQGNDRGLREAGEGDHGSFQTGNLSPVDTNDSHPLNISQADHDALIEAIKELADEGGTPPELLIPEDNPIVKDLEITECEEAERPSLEPSKGNHPVQ